MKFYSNTLDGRKVDVTPVMIKNPITSQLLAIKGARILSFTTETTPKMNKTGNPYFDKVKKLSRVNCLINFDYVKAFEKRTGETHAPTRASSYLRVMHADTDKATPFQVNAKTQENLFVQLMSLNSKAIYIFEGKEIEKDLLKPFFPPYGANPVNVRSYSVDNLLELTIAGEDYNPLSDALAESARLKEILENGLAQVRQRILAGA